MRAKEHREARFQFFIVSRAFVAILLQIHRILDRLVIQLVWYILKQLFTSVSVKVVDIYLHFGN